MGQKIHPLGFRVGITKKHRSVWFCNPKQYPQAVLEDYVIRNTILQSFPSAEISEIHIQRTHHDIDLSPNGLVLIIYAKRPSQLVGNRNEKLQELRTVLKQKLKKCRDYKTTNGKTYINSAWHNFSQILLQKQKTDRIKFLIREITTPYSSAFCIGNEIVKQLQDRQRFRYVVKKVITEIKNETKQRLNTTDGGQPIKGVKIQLAGRLNGAEIARTEWFRKGRVPLHTLKADIDYSYQKAYTKYGIIGIKIWVFAGIKSTKPKLQRTQFLSGYIYA